MKDDYPSPAAVTQLQAGGTDLVFVRSGHESTFAATLTYGVGFAHRSLRHRDGATTHLIPGIVHLAEHVLAYANNATLIGFERRIGSLLPRTTADSVVWTLKGVPHKVESIASEIEMALSVSARQIPYEDMIGAIDHELKIVAMERHDRSTERDRPIRIALQAGLYPDSNLGADPLGAQDRLEAVNPVDMASVLSALAGTLAAVTVVAPKVDGELIDAVASIVERFGRGAPDTAWEVVEDVAQESPVLGLVLAPQHGQRASSASESEDDFTARALFGLRLKPVIHVDQSRRPSMVLLGEVLGRLKYTPRWQATRRSRYIASSATLDVPWSDAGAAPFALSEYRRRMRRNLERVTLETFRNHAEMAVLMDERDVDKLGFAHKCRVFGAPMGDVLRQVRRPQFRVVEELIDEMREAPGTVAYLGPPLL